MLVSNFLLPSLFRFPGVENLVTRSIKIFDIIYNQTMLSKSTGLILILICGLLCLWIIYSVPRFNKKIQNIIIFFSKLGFLVGLFLIAISYLNFAFINSNNLFNLGIEFLLRNLFYLILITTMLGVLASYLVKDNVIEDIKKRKDIELQAEQNRIKKFEAKHKRIAISKDNTSAVNKISEKSLFLKFLSVLKYFMVLWIRVPYRIYRRMYIEGWWYSAGLILILTIGSIVQLSIIGDYYFWTDEVFSFNASMMILEKGKPLFDSGLFYGRARIYHYLMAGSMFLFGIDEFGSRFINVLFSIFTAILIYYLLKDTSKKLGLFGAFLFMFSNLTIAMIIETRFYAFFTFTFLGMAITFYKAFIENLKDDFGDNILKKIKDDRKWLFLFLIVAYIAYNTHDFFFIIIFGLALYYFLSLLIDKSWKINLFFFLSCVGIIFAGAYYLTGSFNLYHAYFEAITLSWAVSLPRNPGYYTGIIKSNLPFYYLLLTTSIVVLLTRLSQQQKYYFALLVAGLFIISLQKALQERYLFFLIPLIFIVASYSLYFLYISFREYQIAKYIIILIAVAFTLLQLHLYVAEVNRECNNGCLAVHKKFKFHEAMNLLDEVLSEEDLLLADYHAAFTLKAYDYDVDYIIISEDQKHLLRRGIDINGVVQDHYFNIPYLIQESTAYINLIDNHRLVIMARGEINLVEGLNPIFDQRPRVYANFSIP